MPIVRLSKNTYMPTKTSRSDLRDLQLGQAPQRTHRGFFQSAQAAIRFYKTATALLAA
jgi:hypothetical protein